MPRSLKASSYWGYRTVAFSKFDGGLLIVLLLPLLEAVAKGIAGSLWESGPGRRK